jgi:8-amino-7-oxononanoate synthase
MLDFTSVLYLGIHHAHRALPSWTRLTTGRPAALEPAPEGERLSQDLARLLRCERAVLAPSTLHVFLDLFDVLASEHIAIYADAGTYPIARWGIERAGARGIQVTTFPKHDPTSLERILSREQGGGQRPVVVTDGVCPDTGRAAPLSDYLRLVRKQSGYLVIDDTQALGILGERAPNGPPYGRGGGGTPAWHGIEGPELIIGSSLAKGFSSPLAVVASNARVIANFQNRSATRVHCSPPSIAVISAAQRALAINDRRGDFLRDRVAKLVRHFKDGLHRIGLASRGGLFPVQTLTAIADLDLESLHCRLLDLGVRAVLRRPQNSPGPALSFLITALHTRSDIGRCTDALRHACALAGVDRGMAQRGWGGMGSVAGRSTVGNFTGGLP